MTSIADLMKRDDVRASWFYTHSEDHSSDNRFNPDMYDVVFSIDDGISLYGGRMNRRHAMFQGIGQAPALSRSNQGDRLVKPSAVETLSNLLSDAIDADNNPTFKEWCDDQDTTSGVPAPDLVDGYERIVRTRDALKTLLGDRYDEYMTAWS